MTDQSREHIKTYIVTFDASHPFFASEAVYQHIKSSRIITNWWNWLPFVFIVESPAEASTISEDLRRAAAGTRFLVAEVDLENSEGVLAQEAWNWIVRRQRKSVHATPQSA